MDALPHELSRMLKGATLAAAGKDVDNLLEQLLQARESIANDPSSASVTLAKLQNPVKQGFDQIVDDLKKVHQAQTKFTKTLDQVFPAKPLPIEHDALAPLPALLNRAIAMHFLREGQFGVASTFLNESHSDNINAILQPGSAKDISWAGSQQLQDKFETMYRILQALKDKDLSEAIAWATQNSQELYKRGSNLEFELIKLQYIWLFLGPQLNHLPDLPENDVDGAIAYGREQFPRFGDRYMYEIQRLAAAVAYRSNIAASPYRLVFTAASAWDTIATSFTRDFCSLLGLSAESPLYLACTAGAIALPVFAKLAMIVKEKHTEWTSTGELPVEIPLPEHMMYHAIFVCPVSKEQSTESNPPMMMPCSHVVARESLTRITKGTKSKCPYCPMESSIKDARQIYL